MYKLNRYLYAIMAIVMITLINPLQAKADLFNIQFVSEDLVFGGTIPVAYTGIGVTGITGSSSSDYWNQAVGTTGTISPLLLASTGLSSPLLPNAQVAFNGQTSTGFYDGSGFSGGTYNNLMTGYLSTGSQSSMTFTGLKASSQYDLYVYSQGNNNKDQLNINIVNGVSASTSESHADASTFIQGQNYLKIQVTTDNQGGFVMNYSPVTPNTIVPLTHNVGIINGIQLSSAVPEPSTVTLIGLGGLLVAFRLRKSPVAI